LEASVQLPGFRDDLPALLPCLNLLVHPATMEGLGIILLQASASGLPVVASAAGGIPEAVVHQETGLLVPPGDPRALASAVSSLLADPARAHSMGQAGRRRIKSAFSVDRMVAGNLEVYQELLSESSSS
jgi:glycosyltransferase involved in cell wall biosynthesis